MAQALDTPGETLVVASRSHPQDLPVEWLSDGFWATWSRVTLLVRSASDEERIARLVSGRSRARDPWAEAVAMGCGPWPWPWQ